LGVVENARSGGEQHNGHMCDGKRQEFILLSDTLGVSMLVDAINHRMPEGATSTTVLEPFDVEGAPELPLGAEVAHAMKGEPLHVSGRVMTTGGRSHRWRDRGYLAFG
jgi:hydroxyquinol 1,2-dioxygenase